jgi:hypothetical protein
MVIVYSFVTFSLIRAFKPHGNFVLCFFGGRRMRNLSLKEGNITILEGKRTPAVRNKYSCLWAHIHTMKRKWAWR